MSVRSLQRWLRRFSLRRLRILIDWLTFRFTYPFLAKGIPEEYSGVFLLVSLTDWVTQVQTDGMFSKALQLRGVEPVVLTWRTARQAQIYFRTYGVTKFIFLDDVLKETASMIDDDVAKNILQEKENFRAFLDVTYRGVRVGNHVLSTVVRRLKKGSGGFQDPAVQELLSQLLPRSLHTVHALEKLFERIKPQFLLFNEKGYSPYGEVFDMATERGIPCIQYVHPHRQDAIVLKRYSKANRTSHPFSLAPSTWERAKNLPWNKNEEETFMRELRKSYEEGTWFNRKYLLDGKKLKTPDEVRTQLKLDPTKKTAVVFSHVLWDATFFFGKTLFADYEQWLVETVKTACANDRVNWIIKLHPDYIWKMKQMGETGDPRDVIALQSSIGKLPDHVQVVMPNIDISTYSFFPITDWCITVRGTIGIEAPCFGIPVITAGTGRYSGLGFTNDSESAEEYLHKLAHIEDIPPLTAEETSLGRRHAWALFELRPLPFTTFEMKRAGFSKVGKGVETVMEIRARSIEDIRNAKDMNTFADWILHSNDEDYLHLT